MVARAITIHRIAERPKLRHVAYVGYPLSVYEWGSIDKELDRLAKQQGSKGENGAGTGFGQRDIDWDFPTRPAAERFIAAVNARFSGLHTDNDSFRDEWDLASESE